MIITKEWLAENDACDRGYEWFLDTYARPLDSDDEGEDDTRDPKVDHHKLIQDLNSSGDTHWVGWLFDHFLDHSNRLLLLFETIRMVAAKRMDITRPAAFDRLWTALIHKNVIGGEVTNKELEAAISAYEEDDGAAIPGGADYWMYIFADICRCFLDGEDHSDPDGFRDDLIDVLSEYQCSQLHDLAYAMMLKQEAWEARMLSTLTHELEEEKK